MFRGREQSRPELGFRLLQKLADDVTELGFVESQPKQDGRNMIMVIGPHRRPPERKPAQAAAQPRPVPSPRSEASVPVAAAETPDEIPDETPDETPGETTAETPVETSAQAPTDAQRFTPVTGTGRNGPARQCGAAPRGKAAPGRRERGDDGDHAEDEDAQRRRQAVQDHRQWQGNAAAGQPGPPARAQVLARHAAALRPGRDGQGRRPRDQAPARQVTGPSNRSPEGD